MQNATILLEAVNTASVSARRSWIFFMSLMAYFAIAISSVTHEQLLLDAPLTLPLLQVQMPVTSFFFFSPIFLVGVHLIMLLQHAALADKVHAWTFALSACEKSGSLDNQQLGALRQSLSIYFYTQALSAIGVKSSRGLLRSSIMWGTITLAPLLLILYFQATFLPYHDVNVTWSHRFAASADLALILALAYWTRFDDILWMGGKLLNLASRIFFPLTWSALTALSYAVLTIPGEPLDKVMSSFELTRTRVPMHLEEEAWKAKGSRFAFLPTAYLFEGQVNYTTGESTTLFGFSRNLIVPDKIIVPDRKYKKNEISLSLRGRDLRYATFDRSNLQNVDFTAARMTAVSLKGADLRETKFGCAEKGKPPYWRAIKKKKKNGQTPIFIPDGIPKEGEPCSILRKANMERADLSGAKIYKANFEQANLREAKLQNTELIQVYMYRVNLTDAKLQNINIYGSNLIGAKLHQTNLQNALIWHSDFSIADLDQANLNGAALDWTSLIGANLSSASLYGTLLPQQKLIATDFSKAKVWWSTLPNAGELKLSKFNGVDRSTPPNGIWESLREEKKISNARSERFFENIAVISNTVISFDTIWKDHLQGVPNEQHQIEDWGNSKEGEKWKTLTADLSRKEDENYYENVVHYMGNLACLDNNSSMATAIVVRHSDMGTHWKFLPDLPNKVPSPKDEALDAVISKLPKNDDYDYDSVGDGYSYYDSSIQAAQLFTRLMGKNCPNAKFIPQEYMQRLEEAAKPPKDETEKSE